MKRLFAFILTGILCLGCFSFASAEDDNKLDISIGFVEGKKGEIVEVPLYAQMTITSNTVGMDSLEFAVLHDKTQLKLIGAVKKDGQIVSDILTTDVVLADNPTEEGYRFAMYVLNTLHSSGVLLTLQYEKLTDEKVSLTITDCKYSFYDDASGEQPRYDTESFTSVEAPAAAETVVLDGSAIGQESAPVSEGEDIPNLDEKQPAVTGDEAKDAATDDSKAGETGAPGTPWYLWLIYAIAAAAIIAGIAVAVVKTKKKEQ